MGQPAYQCFTWQGPRSDLSSSQARCNRTSDLPPVGVREWPYKPDHLCKAIYSDSTNALAWMWSKMGEVVTYMEEHFPEHVPDITRQFQNARHRLEHGEVACQWDVELPNHICVFVAVVAVWAEDPPLLDDHRKGEHHAA